MYYIFFQKTIPALEMYPVSRGTLQIYMKQSQRTPRLKKTNCHNHTKSCNIWGFNLQYSDSIQRSRKQHGDRFQHYAIRAVYIFMPSVVYIFMILTIIICIVLIITRVPILVCDALMTYWALQMLQNGNIDSISYLHKTNKANIETSMFLNEVKNEKIQSSYFYFGS